MRDHLALVEDDWFGVRFLGDDPGPPWDAVDRESDLDRAFRTAAETDPDELRERYPRRAGHPDLRREAIDGTVGR